MPTGEPYIERISFYGLNRHLLIIMGSPGIHAKLLTQRPYFFAGGWNVSKKPASEMHEENVVGEFGEEMDQIRYPGMTI